MYPGVVAGRKEHASGKGLQNLIRGGVLFTPRIPSTPLHSICILASWPSGKARVCKTLIRGSNPLDASESCSKGQLFVIMWQGKAFASKGGVKNTHRTNLRLWASADLFYA
jgi:hypothetical protein